MTVYSIQKYNVNEPNFLVTLNFGAIELLTTMSFIKFIGIKINNDNKILYNLYCYLSCF